MYSKEKAYKLYTMELWTQIELPVDGYLALRLVLRVLGGWIIDSTFVPFNEEFQKYALEPTKEQIKLLCSECDSFTNTYVNEVFQGDEYTCQHCSKIITYKKV